MLNLKLDANEGKVYFFKALIIVFFVRLILAAWLPITSDEAYFVLWGKQLDYGYYDHTPFVGWLLAAFLSISDSIWWLRLPSVLLPILITFGIYQILKSRQPQLAIIVALTFLVAPLNVVNILITTDTPLIFFSFFSAWYFNKALLKSCDDNSAFKYFILSGILLGFAFLSKYFAVFLGVVFGLYILIFSRNKRDLLGLLLIFILVLPFAFINILWNYDNCWSNILFNIYNRASEVTDSVGNLFSYILILTYLYSPLFVFYILKNIKNRNETKITNRVYFWLTIIPLILFLALLIKKPIGLHWLLSFYPFAFIAFSSYLNIKQWIHVFYFMLILSLIHILAVVALLTLPVSIFTSNKFVIQDYIFGTYPEKFLEKLKPYEKDYTFSMISYGMASVASYHSDKHFNIFSTGSVHARLDDKLVNYKELDGKNILIVNRTLKGLTRHERFFENPERSFIEEDGVRFELLIGNKFKYELYKEEVLEKINQRYYKIPDWLPVGQCGFKTKYDLN